MAPTTTALTGIKPSGSIHLGNYLGAIRPAMRLVGRFSKCLYFIADEHALTTVRDRATMQRATLEVAAAWLSMFSEDDHRVTIFRQSDVPEVFELAWILGCVTGKGELDRAHAFKDAEAKDSQVNVGTYTYPVLMAADILAYDTTVVPVGRDQKQHLEIARGIARAFNHAYGGGTLVVPEVIIEENVAVVPGTDGQKMSKSKGNVIPLFASREDLAAAVRGMPTTSEPVDAPKAAAGPVFDLLQAVVEPAEAADVAARLARGGMGWGALKSMIVERLDKELAIPRERYQHYLRDEAALRQRLLDGADGARRIARETLRRVKTAVGISDLQVLP